MERVVADANVLVKWFVEEEYTEQALNLRADHIAGCVEIVAPAHALLEVADALRKYAARGILAASDVVEAVETLLGFGIEFAAIDRQGVLEAVKYSLERGVTAYDAYYIVLAHRLGAPFYTADRKLLDRVKEHESVARHIGAYRRKCR